MDALQQKQHQLDLITRLDQVRDELSDDGDPKSMFDAFVVLLKDWFHCTAAAITLVAETSDDIELVSAVGMPASIAAEMCQTILAQNTSKLLATEPWANTIGIQIILDDYPLGALILARENPPFDENDMAEIELVESQLDSAVMQARMTWKLAQRNRELEAIYEIDRLRDKTANEAELMRDFTSVANSYFSADFCLILLTPASSDNLLVYSIIDKHGLSPAALKEIQQKAETIAIPQVITTPQKVTGLTLLAAPFMVAGTRLGAVVVGRNQPFSLGDHRLLHAMMSQMDSAVVYVRVLQQLTQRKREL